MRRLLPICTTRNNTTIPSAIFSLKMSNSDYPTYQKCTYRLMVDHAACTSTRHPSHRIGTLSTVSACKYLKPKPRRHERLKVLVGQAQRLQQGVKRCNKGRFRATSRGTVCRHQVQSLLDRKGRKLRDLRAGQPARRVLADEAEGGTRGALLELR